MLNLLMRVRVVWGAVFCLALSACGGGGGGGGGGDSAPPPPPATDVANSFFPTASTISWHYVDASVTSQPAVYFSADTVFQGARVHALNYPTGGKEYYVTDISQVGL